jgi:hypothetical protein
MRPILSILLALGAAACASTPGANPHDMSAEQHGAMAQQAEQKAAAHERQYSPGAGAEEEKCNASADRTSTANICWTSIRNPTSEHLAQAEKFRKMAADHRAASQALRDAEAKACVGIADRDRDESPFLHREDIASVTEKISPGVGPRGNPHREGAVIVFRAMPGLTAEWLQRVVDCHIARNAALGHDVPEMSFCPLVPKNVAAKVASTGDGFAVTVTSDDSTTVEEIIRRAKALH